MRRQQPLLQHLLLKARIAEGELEAATLADESDSLMAPPLQDNVDHVGQQDIQSGQGCMRAMIAFCRVSLQAMMRVIAPGATCHVLFVILTPVRYVNVT